MSDFKPGDRVRGNNYLNPELGRSEWYEGVVIDRKPYDSDLTYIRLDGGTSRPVWTATLEPALAEWEKELLGTKAPKFKAGDRVRAERSGIDGQNRRGEWIEGVVTEPYGPENPNELSVRRDTDGHHVFAYADTAVLLDENPKVGDRVRVIHEGTVVAVNGLGFHFRTDDDRSVYAGVAKHEVEVLERKPEPPEPFKPGTTIVVTGGRTNGARPLIRDDKGWRNHGGGVAPSVTDDRVRAGEFEVIFEPAFSS